MGVGSTIVKGTLITGAAVAGVAGFAVYNAGKYVKRLLYPPTVKKYVALGAIPFVLYGIRRPVDTVEAISGTARSIGRSITGAASSVYESRVVTLSGEVAKLEKEKAGLEKVIESLPKPTPGPRHDDLVSERLDSLASQYYNALIVDAPGNKVRLMQSRGDHFEPIEEYACTTGKNPAPKKFAGDLATPEGIFLSTLEEFRGWSTSFTAKRLRIGMPEQLGAGIFVVGTYDSGLLGAINHGTDESNGGIVMRQKDFASMISKVHDARKLPVAISFGSSARVADYTRASY